MTRSLTTALATLSLALAAGGAHAAPVFQSNGNGSVGSAQAAEAAFVAGLDGEIIYENFESVPGYAPGDYGHSIETSVGTFSQAGATPFGNTKCTVNGVNRCADGLLLLDAASNASGPGYSGRYAIDGEVWLDSNDSTEFVFTPVAGATAVGFYITDPNDAGGLFQFSFASGESLVASLDDAAQLIDGGLNNRRAFYITLISPDPITEIRIWSNMTRNGADGFGIDGVTVAVPTPGALALLGAGLLGAGCLRRRRRKA